MHPLLRYEWAVLRGEAALALPGWQDWLMLAVMVALALALLIGSDAAITLRDSRVAVAVGALAGWASVRAARRRLDHLVRESVIAAAALDPVGRRQYGAVVLTSIALLLVAIAAFAGGASILVMVAGMTAGALAAALAPLRILRPFGAARSSHSDARPLTVADAISDVQLRANHPRWRIIVPLVAALASVALTMALPISWNPALRHAIPAATTALTMLALSRVDADIVMFLARMGHGAWHSAGLHLRVAGLYAVILLPLMLLVAPSAFWPCAAAIIVVALFTLLRVWSFRAYSRRYADMILLFGAAGGAVLGASFPPLLIPYLAIAGIALLRRAARATWSMA